MKIHRVAALLIFALSSALAVERAAALPSLAPLPNLSAIAATPNQASMASALRSAPYNAITATPMQTAEYRISALSAPQQQLALNQLSPRAYGAMFPGGSAPGAAAQTGAVWNRMADLRTAAADGGAQGYATSGAQWYPGVALADGIGDVNPGLLSDPAKKFGFFGALTGGIGRQYGDYQGPGYSFNGEGFTVGGDYRLSDAVAVGVSGGMLHTHTSVDQGYGTVDGRAYKFGAYGTAASGGWYADAYVGGGLDYYTAEREIAELGLQAGSNPQGHELNLKFGFGYDARAGRFIVTPFTAVSYDSLNVNAFGENGAGALDMNVAGTDLKSTKGVFGFRVKCASDHRFKPYLSLAYQHEFEPQASLTSSFTGGGQSFTTALATPSPEAALVGVGFDALIVKNVTGHASYDGEYRSGYVSHSLNGNVRLRF